MYLVGVFQRLCTLDEDAIGCPNTCAHHDSCGCGQAQGTGAGDGQHCDGTPEGKLQNYFYPRESFLLLKAEQNSDTSEVFSLWLKSTDMRTVL